MQRFLDKLFSGLALVTLSPLLLPIVALLRMTGEGELERWYVRHRTLRNYLLLIALTVWVVLFPGSGLVWRIFPDLPTPPDELAARLFHPSKS